jgi:hypothetical protein
MIGKIERMPLREVWKHEALNFTTWLQDNIDVLNEALDIELASVEREQSAGAFSVDLVAEDADGDPVIIENQLERSDHDHLGKLITYLTAMDAKTAIWIVSEPRPEHVAAVSWLNESSSASFYLFKVEAIKIGDSDPAPLLTKFVGPSEEAKDIGKKKRELSEQGRARYRFWTQLLDLAKTRTKLHSSISPTEGNWVGASVGVGGIVLIYSTTKGGTGLELEISRGKDRADENARIFNELKSHQAEIESDFGHPLEWIKREGCTAVHRSIQTLRRRME